MNNELLENGYEKCAPGIESDSIDRVIANQSKCPECNTYSMQYTPYTKFDVNRNWISYRAFAVCQNCGYKEEF
jgi:hypothetical protein